MNDKAANQLGLASETELTKKRFYSPPTIQPLHPLVPQEIATKDVPGHVEFHQLGSTDTGVAS